MVHCFVDNGYNLALSLILKYALKFVADMFHSQLSVLHEFNGARQILPKTCFGENLFRLTSKQDFHFSSSWIKFYLIRITTNHNSAFLANERNVILFYILQGDFFHWYPP